MHRDVMRFAERPVRSVAETAEFLGVAEETVRKWLKDGRLEGGRIGRVWLVDTESVMRKLGWYSR